MTDKYIIDGVDVSDCEFYFYREGDEYPHRCSCYKDMYGCSVVCDLADCCKNCVYKQLKRKEQECDRLKHDNDYEVGVLEKTIDNLRAECELLKDLSNHNGIVCNERLDKIDELEYNINELRKQLEQEKTLKEMYFTYYKAKHDDIKGEFFRYKQTFTKIKEIAEWHTTNADSEDIQTDMKQILQLISEVEDEN